MKSLKNIDIVGCHSCGEVGDVVIGGVSLPETDSLWEQSRILARDTRLKDFLLNEPRGGVFRHVNILTPPRNPKADMGFIILEPCSVPPMSGSNTICVTTVLLEMGILPMTEPETQLTLEAPGGLVEVTAACENGKVKHVTFQNLPSFVAAKNAVLNTLDFGALNVDIAFGGDSFVIVQAEDLGIELVPENADRLAKIGMVLRKAADAQIKFKHPTLDGMDEITFCLIAGPCAREDGRLTSMHAVSIMPGKLDRSPTGTGVSARLAILHAAGKVKQGEEVTLRSILGSEFTGRIVKDVKLGPYEAIIPSVTGSAWITGTRQLRLDPDDPWPTGYRLSDTWPSYTV